MKFSILSSLTFLFSFSLTFVEGDEVIYSHVQAARELKNFGKAEYESGKALYQQVCVVCHGDLQKPPVNETVRRFHEVPLENGSRPVDIYRTLSKGYKTMAPQPWMSARQKYEVIHYLREEFFKEHNPSQYTQLEKDYLMSLRGGPDAEVRFPWPEKTTAKSKGVSHSAVDQGAFLFGHFEVNANNYAPKGVILSLDPDANSVTSSKHNVLYDLDTGRMAAFWKGGQVTWTDLSYNGQHSNNARVVGDVVFDTPMGLAWAEKQEVLPGKHVDIRDPRKQALDGRFYGPLGKDHVQYKGLIADSLHPSLHFKVNGVDVIETPWLQQLNGVDFYVRSVSIAPHEHMMYLRFRSKNSSVAIKYFFGNAGKIIGSNRINDGIVAIKPSNTAVTLHIVATSLKDLEHVSSLRLSELTFGGKPLEQNLPWPTLPSGQHTSYLSKNYTKAVSVDAPYIIGTKDNAFQVDTIELPQNEENPWKTRIRLSGIDFLDEDTAALSSWTGDVFVAQNIQGKKGQPVRISRIASGLHQPLGLKVQDGEIYVGCRDQIMRPHDLNGDSVADYYEAFNTDHIVTMHFHDFSAGLDTDSEGNFYYVKCSQHQAPAVHERHGTLIKVSRDGSSSEIIADGLRSCNGCFVDENDEIWLTDQEGYWNPQNKVMRVKPGAFHGNMLGWYDSSKISTADEDMIEPLLWTAKSYANSPSEVFRFPAEGWGALSSQLGYFEYGRGHLMMLAEEEKNGVVQGFTHKLDLPPFPTGVMRGRFHPKDNSLFACGLHSWGSNRVQTGGLFRVSATNTPSYSLVDIETGPEKLVLHLSDAIISEGLNSGSFEILSYYIHRSEKYGSKLEQEKQITVTGVELSSDGKSITLQVPDLAPARIIIIKAKFNTPAGKFEREFHGSLYNL